MKTIEIKLHCSAYMEKQEQCPSAAQTITQEGLEHIKKFCCSEKYKSCEHYAAASLKKSSAA